MRPLRHLRLQAALRRAGGTRSTTSAASPASSRDADREARGGRDHDARRSSAARPPSRRPPGIDDGDVREAPRAGRLQLQRARDRRGRLPAPAAAAGRPASRSCPTPRPATSSSTSRATRSGTSDGSLEYLWGITRRRRRLHAALGARAATRSRPRFETVRRPRPRAARASTRTCTSTTTPQYEITALRRLMGRYGTREAELDDLLRRDVFVDLSRSSAAACASRGRATGSRRWSTSSTSSARPRSRTAAPRSSSSSAGCRARPGDPRRDRRLQPGGLHRDARPARLAARAARRGARAVRAVPAARAGRAEAGAGRRRPSGPRCARRCSHRRRASALAAQLLDYHDRERKPVWWAFFDRIEHDAGGAARGRRGDRRARARPASREPVEALARLHVHLPAAGAQARRGSSRSTTRRGKSAGEIVELDRDARTARAQARPAASTDVPLPQALHPGQAVRHARRRRPRSSGSAARSSPATALSRARVGPAARAVRPRRADDDLDEMTALAARRSTGATS